MLLMKTFHHCLSSVWVSWGAYQTFRTNSLLWTSHHQCPVYQRQNSYCFTLWVLFWRDQNSNPRLNHHYHLGPGRAGAWRTTELARHWKLEHWIERSTALIKWDLGLGLSFPLQDRCWNLHFVSQLRLYWISLTILSQLGTGFLTPHFYSWVWIHLCLPCPQSQPFLHLKCRHQKLKSQLVFL